jgi:hypothetical protein
MSRRSPTYRFIDGIGRGIPTPAVAHYDRSNHHPKGLVKQAYSAKVLLSPTAKVRKWHLTAYFTYEDLENIPTIDQDEMLQRVTVPRGVFRNGKTRSRNAGVERVGRCRSADTETSSSKSASSPKPMYTATGNRTMFDSSSRAEDRRLVLPPLQSTLAHTHTHRTRTAEDHRVIQILNSQHIR